MKQVRIESDFDSWREAARALLAGGTPPEQVLFVEKGLEHALLPGLLEPAAALPTAAAERIAGAGHGVPRSFLRLAECCACHADPERWALLYGLLWRLTHGEPHLLAVAVDDDVHRALMMEKQVRFDGHKMKAFVRFRRVADEHGDRFIAWHRSEHRVLKATAPFFVRRFGVMNWSILTPFDSAHWNGRALTFGPGFERSEAPDDDALEELWRTYYASIFNPARIKLRAMRKEMPRRYWSTMPETQLIPQLLIDAPSRARQMVAQHTERFEGAKAYFPRAGGTITLPQLREAAKTCRGCDLYCNATQTVFGEGPEDARAAIVAEQPGDNEDRAGRPFVGPAGQVFDDALREVGIDRRQLYVSGAVKHFKFELQGKRRIHARPNARQIQACRPWIEAELRIVRPPVLVLMGSTAAQSLIGRHFKITRDRGRFFESGWAPSTIATYHPSALLRIPDPQRLDEAKEQFTSDLRQVAARLAELRQPSVA